MGVLRINQNPYNEFISSGFLKKMDREEGKEGEKRMEKKRGREGRERKKLEENGVGVGEKENE